MKTFFWLFLFSSFLFMACSEKKVELSQSNDTDIVLEVPEIIVSKSAVKYDHKISLWTLNNSPYSGFVVSYYPDSTLKEKLGILNGKKQNETTQWFPDGHLKIVTNYNRGKLHGEKKIWSRDSLHVLIAQFQYHNGKANGEQKKWYPSGQLYQKLNLNEGKELGLQQAYRKNGVLYANYEAKHGRIFGLKKANLCYQLEDEVITKTK